MTSKYKYLLILIGLFFIQFLFISPIGEFAINDDWVHAEMVQHWVTSDSFRINPYTGPTLHAFLAFGAGLSKIFGFSFTLLRLGTLTLTLAMVVFFYLLLHHLTNNPRLSFLGTIALWLNPIVFSLSFTFMTDVPALFLVVVSIFCAIIAFEKNDHRFFFVASLLSILGFFVRQTNILLIPAIGLILLLDKKYRSFKNIGVVAIPCFIWAGVYYSLYHFELLPHGDASHDIKDTGELIRHALWWSYYTFMYLGLFTLPLTISSTKAFSKRQALSIASFLLFVSLAFFFRGRYFPYVPNTINQFGLGPFADVLQGKLIPIFNKNVWYIITFIAAVGSGLLLEKLYQARLQFNFLWIFAGLFLATILFLTGFDRYFLSLMAIAIILVSIIVKDQKSWIPSAVILLILTAYSVSQTQFYINWNRIRWDIANRAEEKYHLQPYQLEAGYEWDGWNDYWGSVQANVGRGPDNSPWWVKFLMTNNTLDYAVSASPLPKYSILEKRIVPGWNPNNTLYLLKKDDVTNPK